LISPAEWTGVTGALEILWKTTLFTQRTGMNPINVILVDDEEEYVTTLSERIQMRGFNSRVAPDGEQALKMIHENTYHVMVLDLRMPGIDGMAVLKAVKKTHPEMQVVMITGHGSDLDKENALGNGAFAYMEKPVELDALIDYIKKACPDMC
jgi:DNA-binding NtrC family response regulator